jgi:hypothetical protein
VTRETAQAQAQLAQERRLPVLKAEDVAAALAAGGAEIRIATFADLREAKRSLQERFIEPSAPGAPSNGR